MTALIEWQMQVMHRGHWWIIYKDWKATFGSHTTSHIGMARSSDIP